MVLDYETQHVKCILFVLLVSHSYCAFHFHIVRVTFILCVSLSDCVRLAFIRFAISSKLRSSIAWAYILLSETAHVPFFLLMIYQNIKLFNHKLLFHQRLVISILPSFTFSLVNQLKYNNWLTLFVLVFKKLSPNIWKLMSFILHFNKTRNHLVIMPVAKNADDIGLSFVK